MSLLALVVQQLQVGRDAAAFDAPRFEVMIQHVAHQVLRLGRGLVVGVMLLRERQ